MEYMKASTKNRAEGKLREAKGAVKEALGALANDKDMEIQGNFEKKVGKAQGAFGRAEKAVGR